MKSFLLFLESEEYRAKEGESEVVHHLTTKNFDPNSFRPLSHFGTKKAARDVIKNRVELETDKPIEKTKPKHHAVRLSLGNVVTVKDNGDYHSPAAFSKSLHKAGHLDAKQAAAHERLGHNLTNKRIASDLRKNGIHTIKYKNNIEDPGSTSYMITHPSQVRPLRSTKPGQTAKVNWKRTTR